MEQTKQKHIRILYNPKAGNGEGKQTAEAVWLYSKEPNTDCYDLTDPRVCEQFIKEVTADDTVILCGGDGTLMQFVNSIEPLLPNCRLLYYASGSGNDFARDVDSPKSESIDLFPYLSNLPSVTVNGQTYRFLNGVGFGIDGYCCEEGDRLRKTAKKAVNYTKIAIKGLLFHYHPTNAVVTVDGVEHRYRNVWLAPTMNGRYYGGGMIPTPGQDRLHNETVSTLIMHGAGKLRTLFIFPSIFKGTHIRHKNVCEVLHGRVISVAFDNPTPLQIDGETFMNVTDYTVRAPLQNDDTKTS